MVFKKGIIAVIILFVAMCIPCISQAADYVVALDAGHIVSNGLDEDIKWFEEMNPGESWNHNWDSGKDYDNNITGIITTTEGTLTQKTVMYMVEYLKQYDNIDVVICPRSRNDSSRPYYARDKNADVHISMHYNASPIASRGKGKGTETWYKDGADSESMKFAEIIVDSVTKATNLKNRGAKPDGNYDIIKTSSQMNGAPSIVLEGAFFDNEDDLLFLSEEANLKKIAAGTVSGILAYLGVEDKGYPDIPDYQGYSGSGGSSSALITSNENKFLGLWMNATGVYEPYYEEDGVTINQDALYRKDGTSVIYSSYTNSVAGSIIGASDWFFTLLESSERTQNHLTIMKYLMNVYTDTKDYGDLEFDKDIATLFTKSSGFNSVSGIYGGTIQEKVWFALRDVGCSEIAVAGAMGNIHCESGGFSVDIIENGGSGEGIGLCQWSFDRRTQIETYAASKGVDWSDEDTQVEFLVAEVTGEGPAASYATKRTQGSILNEGIISTSTDWLNSTTVEDSTLHFMRFFESPRNKDGGWSGYTNRVKFANEYYNEFKGRTKPTGSSLAVANGTAQEKLAYLFPDGVPTTESECKKYMTTIDVALTKKDGTKTTGKLTVHKAVAQDVQDVFKIAQDSGFKIYEASAYGFRKMNNGGSGSLSHHSYGIAIDINVNENYSRKGSTIYAGSFWDPSSSEYSIPQDGALVKAFKEKGWKWGGNWSGNYQDYMHFSFTGN